MTNRNCNYCIGRWEMDLCQIFLDDIIHIFREKKMSQGKGIALRIIVNRYTIKEVGNCPGGSWYYVFK